MYSSYSPYLSSDSTSYMSNTADEILTGMHIFILVIAIVIGILTILAHWKIFTKAGEKGWKAIIPIYNTIILFKIIGISPWLVLVYLVGMIPVIGSFITFGFTIYVMYKLSMSFGKSGGFTVGLVFLNTIFLMILAFGSAEYQLDRTTTQSA